MTNLPADHWIRSGFVVLDTETTGTDVETAQIASISAGVMRPGSAPSITTAFIAVEMPEEASEVNGLTTELLAERATDAAPAVLEHFVQTAANALSVDMPLVIANAPYDLTVLDRECRRHDVPTITARLGLDRPINQHIPERYLGPVVDPIVLDKRAVKFRHRVSPTQGARQLKTLCQVHGCGWDDELAHSSEYDAVMAGRVTWQLINRFPGLSGLSLESLHLAQVGWYAEQSKGLRAWFQSEAVKREQWSAQAHRAGDGEAAGRYDAEIVEFTEKARSVDEAWPIRPWVAPAAPVVTPEVLAWVDDPVAANETDPLTYGAGGIPICGCGVPARSGHRCAEEVPPRPVTDEEIAALPVLDPEVLDEARRRVELLPEVCQLDDCGCSGVAHP